VDRILLVHALEMSDDPEGLLRRGYGALAGAVGAGDGDHPEPARGMDRPPTTRRSPRPALFGLDRSRIAAQTWFTPTVVGER